VKGVDATRDFYEDLIGLAPAAESNEHAPGELTSYVTPPHGS
jgi:hypothetical protein